MSLAEMSEFIKKAVKIVGLLIGAYLLALILKAPVKSVYLALFPPKNLPTATFGMLEPLSFTQESFPASDPEYVLNTTSGNLPADIPEVVPVYTYERPGISYSAGERAQEYARALGFTDDMRVSDLSADIFRWEDVTFGGTLEVNLNNRNISLTTPFNDIGRYFPAGNLSKSTATNIARDILTRLDKYSGTLYEDALPTEIEVEFGKFRPNGLIEADSILEAQIAKIDFFRKIGDIPVLGPNPKEGLLQVYLRQPQKENPQLNYPVVQAYEWKINLNQSGTYPLTPLNQVWAEIQENNGVVTNLAPANANPFSEPTINSALERILINDVYLAYFDSKTYQRYAQPIYVFEGNYTARNNQTGEITIYYPAISNEYIELTNN